MKRILSLILSVVILSMLITACNGTDKKTDMKDTSAATENREGKGDSSTNNNETSTTDKKEFTIGIVPYYLSDQFCKWLMNSFEKRLKSDYPNFKYKIIDGEGKVDTTIAAIEQFTAQKVDLIILQPFDADAFVPSVKNALNAGIKVVCTNVGINDGGETPFVITDFKANGIAQGGYLKDKIPQNAEVAILKGAPVAPANMRKEGLQESLLNERKDLKIVAELNANWRKDEAMKITEDWLLKFPNLQYILAQSDEMAMGAVEAVRAVNKIGKIKIAAIGGTAQACVAIKNGELMMSVFEDAKTMADMTLELCSKILNGEKYEKANYLPNPVIDSTNVDEYIKIHKEAGNMTL